MKVTITLTGLLFATATMACPSLEGFYKSCRSTSQAPRNVVVEQKLMSEGPAYRISYDLPMEGRTSEVYIADGKIRSKAEPLNPWEVQDPKSPVLKRKSICNGDKLVIEERVMVQGKVTQETTLVFTAAAKELTMVINQRGRPALRAVCR